MEGFMINHQELFPIVEKLEEYRIKYALGGSGLLHFLGLTGSVNDWDITVDCPKEALLKAISGYEWIEQPSGDGLFASEYRISLRSLKIDFIGCFALRSEAGVVHLPVSPMENWDGIRVSSPEVWYIAYDLMGRKAKADMLLNYLKSNKQKVNSNLLRDLLKITGLTYELSQQLRSLDVHA